MFTIVHKGVVLACLTFASVAFERDLHFDGQDDYVLVPSDPAFDLLNGFTLEAWIAPDVLGTDANLVSRQTQAGQFAPWSFTQQGNRLRLWLEFTQYLSDPVLVAGEWQHVAVTWTAGAGQIVFYRNGAQVSHTFGLTQITVKNYNVMIGGLNGALGWSLKGMIAEVRAWNRVRAADEIRRTAFRRLTQQESQDPSLVGCWHLDDGSGQVAGDSSTFANDGQLGNSANPDAMDPRWTPRMWSVNSPNPTIGWRP